MASKAKQAEVIFMGEIGAKKCEATTKTGRTCEAWAQAGRNYCFHHDPTQAAERAKARKTGGLNRKTPHGSDYTGPAQVRTLADVLAVLDYVLGETVRQENSTARNRLLVAICAEYTNAIRTGELEARLQALEMVFKERDSQK